MQLTGAIRFSIGHNLFHSVCILQVQVEFYRGNVRYTGWKDASIREAQWVMESPANYYWV
jgi:hypothetical protein